MNFEQAIHDFFSSFDIAAYDENTVPQNAEMPRLTYNIAFGEFGDSIAISADLWYNSYSWELITRKAREISDAVGYGGTIIPTDDGLLWIKRGTPFYRRISDDEDSIRRIYFNFDFEYLTSR